MPHADEEPFDETSRPWLRKMLWLCTLLLLAGAVGFWWLRRDVDPPDVSDLRIEPIRVPDEQNAFQLLNDAAAALSAKLRDTKLRRSYYGVKPTAQQLALVDAALAESEPARTLLREAMSRPYCATPKELFRADSMPQSYSWYLLGEFLRVDFKRRLELGDRSGAMGDALALVRLGHLLCVESEYTIQWRFGIRNAVSGAQMVCVLAADPAVTCDDLQAMAAACARQPNPIDGAERAIKGDYCLTDSHIRRYERGELLLHEISIMNSSTPGSLKSSLMDWVSRLVFRPNLTRTHCAALSRQIINDLPQVYSKTCLNPPASIPAAHPYPGLEKELTGAMQGQLEHIAKLKSQWRCVSGAVQLLTAVRLHEIKHGDLPDRLDALVPDLLPAVPADPYDGEPFRYSREQRLIYSVGENLRDDHAKPLPPKLDNTQWYRKDIVFPLPPKPVP